MEKKQIIRRIKAAYNFENDGDFADYLGITKQTLSNWKARNAFDIELLYTKCEHINPDFLFTGKGEVKKNKKIADSGLARDLKFKDVGVPLYNIDATSSIATLFNNVTSSTVDYVNIPNLSKCDGAVYVTGDSMHPVLKSGDIVIYKEIHDIINDIFWGEIYLLGIDLNGEEEMLIKYIQKSDKEGYVKLVSQNKHHEDKDIKLSKITALALVKASVRINSMRQMI